LGKNTAVAISLFLSCFWPYANEGKWSKTFPRPHTLSAY